MADTSESPDEVFVLDIFIDEDVSESDWELYAEFFESGEDAEDFDFAEWFGLEPPDDDDDEYFDSRE